MLDVGTVATVAAFVAIGLFVWRAVVITRRVIDMTFCEISDAHESGDHLRRCPCFGQDEL